MIIDCDRKRDHTPVTCGVIDRVSDPDGVGGVTILTYDSFEVALDQNCPCSIYLEYIDDEQSTVLFLAQVAIPATAARCDAATTLRRGEFPLGHAPRVGRSRRGGHHCWRQDGVTAYS